MNIQKIIQKESEKDIKMSMPKKCETCGEILGPFERKVCGPCRMKDPRFKEELDE